MRSLDPPPPERSAELRRRFAEEVRSERPDLTTLCLLVGAEGDGALDEAGMDAAQIELDRLAGLLPYRPGGPRAWARVSAAPSIRSPCARFGRPVSSSRPCCVICWVRRRFCQVATRRRNARRVTGRAAMPAITRRGWRRWAIQPRSSGVKKPLVQSATG